MGRRGSDKVILDGTTMGEVLDTHRDTLVLALGVANREVLDLSAERGEERRHVVQTGVQAVSRLTLRAGCVKGSSQPSKSALRKRTLRPMRMTPGS
jgi:hypothetical protein